MTDFDVRRIVLNSTWTLGMLWWPGKLPDTFILEDQMREVPGRPVTEWKVAKATAIPVGRYQVIIDMSTRFAKELPHILNVQGFTGVRFHGGVNADDTEGCPLTGFGANLLSGALQQGLAASGKFMEDLRAALALGECFVNIKNPL